MFVSLRRANSIFAKKKTQIPDAVQHRLEILHQELAQLRGHRKQQEAAIENIENIKLRQRLQENLDNIIHQEGEKMQEVK